MTQKQYNFAKHLNGESLTEEISDKTLQSFRMKAKNYAMNLIQFQLDGKGMEELQYTAFTLSTSAGFASDMVVDITYFQKNDNGEKTKLVIDQFRVVGVWLSLLNNRMTFRIKRLDTKDE